MNKPSLLARWLAGELTEAELREFQKTEDYAVYAKIAEKATQLSPPNFDTEKSYSAINERRNNRNSSKRTIFSLQSLQYAWRVAAVLAIVAGSYFFFNSGTTEISTGIAEKSEFNLPDASNVSINALSHITYNKKKWKQHRSLTLNGEAFFKVTKGNTFDVKTNSGIVTVVGTEFNVKQRNDLFEVACYEGVVKVTHLNKNYLLTEGMGVQIINGVVTKHSFKGTFAPSWIQNESDFKSIPLREVLAELELHYDLKVTAPENIQNILYSGTFSHNNLESALKSICLPLQLSYTLSNNDKRVTIHE